MPPNKSRRLPGGKVRRPSGPSAARPTTLPLRPSGIDELRDDAPDELTEGPADDDTLDTAVSLEDFRVARPVLDPAPQPSRRLRERRGRAPVTRTGPSPMELAALNYRHIRGDLLRIAIIALVMFGIIVALSFVIK
jgi:hypothetical protein